MDNETRERIRTIMAQVFNVVPARVADDASPDTIPAWDSVGHMNLILALEEEFGISFSDQQSMELKNFELAVCVVNEALETRGG